MGSNVDSTVEIARISRTSAIVVAAITGLVAVIGSLASTGYFTPRRSEGTASSSGPSAAARAPVIEAPQLSFAAKDFSPSLEECMEKARGALERGKLTGIESAGHYAWGYRGEAVGSIWCHTDARQLIFLASSKSQSVADEVRLTLERSF